MRDGWSATSTWALVDGGPHGSLNCGHAHADALTLEVATNGRSVLTASGTFSYTGTDRDHFRATASHNTATVDGELACRGDIMFALVDKPEALRQR